MKNNKLDSKEEFINNFNLYFSKWKYFVLSMLFFLLLAFLYLRYTSNIYNSTAIIKIKDEQQNNQLAEISSMQNFGMFSNNFSNVVDEVAILKSKTLIEQTVKDLNLNVSFYIQGRIKEKESYLNPPFNFTFLKNDSIIDQIESTFYITVISDSKFKISFNNTNEEQSISTTEKVFNFGDKLDNTPFGELIITPNLGAYGTKIGSIVKVQFLPVNKVVDLFQKELIIQNTDGSNIINLSLSNKISAKSENFLNVLIKKYNEDAIKDKNEVIKISSDFINNRLEVVSEELEKVDLTAESLKKDNRLSDLTTQSNIFLQSEKENENQLITTSNQIQLIDYMEEHISSNNSDGDLLPANVGINDPNIALVTKSHNDLVLQRNRILKNSSNKNPTVINLNNQIKALKDNLQQSLLNLKSSTKITLNSLQKTDSRINAQIYSAPTKERKFRDITRQQSIKESLYLYLLEKREESAITLGMSPPNAKIIDVAHSEAEPISPKKGFAYLAALVLGFVFPFMFYYIKDLLDNKIHNKKDLTNYLSIPFIGEIPKSNIKNLNVKKVDYSPKAEAFRILRTNIDFMLQNISHKSKIIFVTSTTSKEGKSHTSVNLTLSLSHSQKKVLFIETDIRVPKGTRYLNIENQKGLTDYISNDSLDVKDVIVKTKDNPYLDIIPSGTIPPNPAELLMDKRVEDLFNTVQNDYDYIIVDTAAVGLVTDTLLISKYADLFVYVVKADYLDKRNLQIAQTMFDEKRLPNMTILLNNVDHKRSYGYGYGYGYGKNPNSSIKWWQLKKG
ncbi:tyrosine-protein kinase [Formosa agariphila KMM 3901]|uniref:non-specific protein-tyrosine kinase n=1 Tax=Formosa agariphila (strain DSM 15362 / KCTC 12365 / LMG 23005 / KMM 3901 / M-2Alg 35-1) TaxID=1347342 RepID=T2KNI6_FORAG|nr:polysaccharide biosynthesis tyrosine autokinase [Formosa agariphila]CDF80001.1 tyrosine-protein kinase [Formosa agariphila KMM 3901]